MAETKIRDIWVDVKVEKSREKLVVLRIPTDKNIQKIYTYNRTYVYTYVYNRTYNHDVHVLLRAHLDCMTLPCDFRHMRFNHFLKVG